MCVDVLDGQGLSSYVALSTTGKFANEWHDGKEKKNAKAHVKLNIVGVVTRSDDKCDKVPKDKDG